jgi:hypothetical protein
MEEIMNDPKKIKYLTKKVRFNGKDMTLYSVDGCTWSSRRDELTQIIERHESEKLTFGEIRGQLSANKPIAPKKSPEKFNKFREAALEEKQKAIALVEAEATKKKEAPVVAKSDPKKAAKKEVKAPVKNIKPALPVKKAAESTKRAKTVVKETPKKRASGKPAKKQVKSVAKAKKK